MMRISSASVPASAISAAMPRQNGPNLRVGAMAPRDGFGIMTGAAIELSAANTGHASRGVRLTLYAAIEKLTRLMRGCRA